MTVWRVRPGQETLWRFWDGSYVVFSVLSGETHLLDIVTGKIFERLMEDPCAATAMGPEIADFLEVENDSELARAIGEVLRNLEDIGLVETAT